jgi:hypothetical protein
MLSQVWAGVNIYLYYVDATAIGLDQLIQFRFDVLTGRAPIRTEFNDDGFRVCYLPYKIWIVRKFDFAWRGIRKEESSTNQYQDQNEFAN